MSFVALNSNCLVLNRNYMAVRIISVKRAFTLLFRSVAEVVHTDEANNFSTHDFDSWREVSIMRSNFSEQEHGEWIKTVTFEIMVPRIVRLLVYDRLPRREVKFNRRNIFARDRNRCQYCGKKFPTTDLSFDHVIPRSMGGKTSWGNVVTCCLKCNVKKGGSIPRDAHMKLISRPVKPRRSPAVTIHLGQGRYRTWRHFLDNAYWSVELKD